MANAPAIKANGLVKVYDGLRAVDGIDLTVPEGIVFALLGPNGAGKTTTVEILEGLRKPTAGSAQVLGEDITRSYEGIRQVVGILPQDFEPFDRLTPREHLRYFARLFGRRADPEEIARILLMVGLMDRADVHARKLSGGEKRKLGIAMSLVGDPHLIFLDEPTTGLDPAARRDLWGVVRGLRKVGRTVVLTTHYIEEAEALADDVAIMVKGKIVASGSPESLVAEHTERREVRLVGAGPGALEKLAKADFEVTLDGEDIVLRAKATEGLGAVLMYIVESGVTFDDVITARPRLEDVFLSIVGTRIEEGELRS